MITAKNYAVHAMQAAQEIARNVNVTGSAKQASKDIAYLIPRAQHFAIPDGGKILNDGLMGLIGTEFRMPFDIITVECFCDGAKYCVTAVQQQEGAECVFFFAGSALGDKWKVLPLAAILKGVDERGVHMQVVDDSDGYDEIPKSVQFLSETVLELCEALSCKNVTHDPIERIDPAVNARRVRAGKLPLFETHQLVIDAGKPVTDSAQGGGTHASPRQHLRRGHIRRLSSGNVWVNSCVVGSAENGVIKKNYVVRGAA